MICCSIANISLFLYTAKDCIQSIFTSIVGDTLVQRDWKYRMNADIVPVHVLQTGIRPLDLGVICTMFSWLSHITTILQMLIL